MTFPAKRAQPRSSPLLRSAFRRPGSAWIRRALALMCLVMAALSALSVKNSAAATMALVVVVNRDVPAGATLTANDIRAASWPSQDRPANAVATQGLAVGLRLASSMAAGELLTRSRVLGSDLTKGLAPGLSASPIALDGRAAADVVHAGDRVDLLVSGSESGSAGRVLADNVEVLAVLPGTTTSTAFSSETDLIVAVDRETALRLASAAGLAVLATVRNHQ